jgi:hypothetical protein
MRPTAILLACALGLLFAASVNAQENATGKKHDVQHGNLHFEFTHSLRIPDYHVTVDFYEYPGGNIDSIEVRAISEPMPGHGYAETKRDSVFWISKGEYEKLQSAVNSIELPKARLLDVSSIGTDGTICVIEYGDSQNSIAIKVWSPSDKNGPLDYYSACKLILKSGGFDPHKIFDF